MTASARTAVPRTEIRLYRRDPRISSSTGGRATAAAAHALDRAATGGWPGWQHLTILAVWTVVASAAAVRWFRWE